MEYRYDVEYRDVEGDNYEQSFDNKREAWDFIRGLPNRDCQVIQTWIYRDNEYVGSFY